MLTQSYLKSIFHYNPLTSDWTYLVDTMHNKAGTVTRGYILEKTGYAFLSILGTKYGVHSLVILYMEGIYPKYVDHKDVNPSNNIYSNLRVCTHSQNQCNSKLRSDNTTGIKGLSFITAPREYYLARVNLGKVHKQKCFLIDLFISKEAAKNTAIIWLKNKREELHGEFCRHE